MSNQKPEHSLDGFVAREPGATYTFDSERDADKSEICRVGKDGKTSECIELQMHSKKLFEAMTAKGYFCALPIDPTRTHMECTPIPKS